MKPIFSFVPCLLLSSLCLIILNCSSSVPEIVSFRILSDRFTANPTVRLSIETEDDSKVTGWFIAEASTKPALDAAGWQDDKPDTYALSSATLGSKTLYAWVRNGSETSDEASASLKHVDSGTEDTADWNKEFDGDAGEDSAIDVAVDSQGNIYVAGYGTNLAGASSKKDWWIKKFDSDGNEDTVNWDKRIDAGANEDDAVNSLAIDDQDNVYVAGYGYNLASTISHQDWWIKKYDSEGNEDTTNWNLHFDGGVGNDIAYDIKIDADGYVYVVGTGYGVSSGSNIDWWIKKFDSEGNEDIIDWDKKINGSTGDDGALALGFDSDKNVYVAGLRYSAVTTYDWWIKKFTSAGTEITTGWNKVIDSGSNGIDSAMDLLVGEDDSVYVAGYGYDLVSSTKLDWWIKKYDSEGTEDTTNWNNKYWDGGTEESDYAMAMAFGMNRDLFVAGTGTGLLEDTTNLDWWIRRFTIYAMEDTTDWNKKYDGWYDPDGAHGIAVTPEGSVYVVGFATDIVDMSSGRDWWIKKFAYFSSGGIMLKND